MGRPVIYFDYYPVNIYPKDNQVPALVNQHPIPVPPAVVPDHINLGARPDQGPFASAGVEIRYPGRDLAMYNQEKGFMGKSTTWLFITSKSPIRYDDYNQGVQPPRAKGMQKSGTSPNQGVYTGKYELESYSYYSGVQEELT